MNIQRSYQQRFFFLSRIFSDRETDALEADKELSGYFRKTSRNQIYYWNHSLKCVNGTAEHCVFLHKRSCQQIKRAF